ncbi:MAG: DNA polymerase III subunit alpha, partial [Roseiflexaceae bacterium]|nr:DNA polymerase III subunit alpha [Roseiflexaceae bacterium]
PLQRTSKDENAFMVAFEGPTLAKMGLLKMDILGLSNLSIVAEALKYIEQTSGRPIELADIPLDDKKTFVGLSRGETKNVFQLESAGMTRYLMQLKPTRVDDLYAMVALYRPGPLEQIPLYIHNKNNPRDVKYLHPILKPILEDTYGVIVYQEQIMQLLQAIAGYTLGNAYIVLKAIGKKNKEMMAAEEPRFKDGCSKNGLTKDQANELWNLIQPFAGYSFNRPHSTLYGLLSYQTAWLKTNHPTEYMAAVLTAAVGQIEDVAKSVAECGRLGVAVLPPDLNRSNEGFSMEQLPAGQALDHTNRLGVRFGLSAIRNVGSGPVQAAIEAREQGGPFKSVEDFCDRVHRSALNKRVLESLIKCGAMDAFPGTRHQKCAVLDQMLAAGVEAQKAREAGQASMFEFMAGGDSPGASVQSIPLPPIRQEPQHDKEALGWEKELLGMYVSNHPIANALETADLSGVTMLGAIADEMVGQVLTFCGMITATRKLATKKGDSMLVATFEDMEASLELVVFPKTYEKTKDLLVEDALLCITAKVDRGRKDDAIQLLLESAKPLETMQRSAAKVQGSGTTSAGPDPRNRHFTGGAGADDVLADMDFDGVAMSLEQNLPPLNDAPHPADTPTDAAASGPDPLARRFSAGNQEAAPADAGPISVIKSRVKVSTNGNGNGNGNGHAAAAPVANGSKHTLHLSFSRTRDFDADIRMMQDVDELLRAYEGEDEVLITLFNQASRVVIKPHHTVRTSDDLLGPLRGMLGSEAVVVG